ncbi:MAG: hypothetical protein GY820_31230 [Gammaproteobacteria bacterium]|nr:hypothetical protein [Gammaproteobacteria bacterium]
MTVTKQGETGHDYIGQSDDVTASCTYNITITDDEAIRGTALCNNGAQGQMTGEILSQATKK